MAKETPRTCFVATPISADLSTARRATDGLIAAAILPILKGFDLDVVVPHEMTSPGSITAQIICQLVSADLVIANLTGLNPNVMYELAIRHSLGRPVVIVAEIGTILPFDVAGDRVVFYVNDMQGSRELFERLQATIRDALSETQPDNPVYRAVPDLVVQRPRSAQDVRVDVLSQIEHIDQRLAEVLFNQRNPPWLSQKSPPSSYFTVTVIVKVDASEGATRQLAEEISKYPGLGASNVSGSQPPYLLEFQGVPIQQFGDLQWLLIHRRRTGVDLRSFEVTFQPET